MMDYHHQLKNKNGLKTTSHRGGHFLFIINKAGNLVHFRRSLRVSKYYENDTKNFFDPKRTFEFYYKLDIPIGGRF